MNLRNPMVSKRESKEEEAVDFHQDHLNLDIILEILSRSSLETVGKCRLLSKECRSLTYDSVFMNLHSQRSKIISGYFVQQLLYGQYYASFVPTINSGSHSHLSLGFLPRGHWKIEASTNPGILLCINYALRIPRFCVCKPSTKEWRSLPNPKTRYRTEAIGMNIVKSNPLHYKIVRFSTPKSTKKVQKGIRYRCEVFDSETWLWRQMCDLCLLESEFLANVPATSTCGSLHWLTTEKRIVAFNQHCESYSIFSLAQQVFECDDCGHINLIEFEGKLAAVFDGRDQQALVELWVMENYDKKVWNKRRVMSIEAINKLERHARSLAFHGSDVAIIEGCYRLILFNLKNESVDTVRLNNSHLYKDLIPFFSDFEPLNWMVSRSSQRRSKSMDKKSSSSSVMNLHIKQEKRNPAKLGFIQDFHF